MELSLTLLSTPSLFEAYLSGLPDVHERMLILVSTLDVASTVERRKFYTWLPTLAHLLHNDEDHDRFTIFQKTFCYACALDKFNVVLNLIDHPDMASTVYLSYDEYENAWVCAWDWIFYKTFEVEVGGDYHPFSERVAQVLYNQIRALDYDFESNLSHLAFINFPAFQWLFNRLPVIGNLTIGDSVENLLDILYDHDPVNIQQEQMQNLMWILNHEKSLNMTYTIHMLQLTAGFPYFLHFLQRFITTHPDGLTNVDVVHSILNDLTQTPVADLQALLCCRTTVDMFTLDIFIQFLKNGPTIENMAVWMNHPKTQIPANIIYHLLRQSDYHVKTRTRLAEYVLSHHRVMVVTNDLFPLNEMATISYDVFSVLIKDVRYIPVDEHLLYFAQTMSSKSLKLLMDDARVNVNVNDGDVLIRLLSFDVESWTWKSWLNIIQHVLQHPRFNVTSTLVDRALQTLTTRTFNYRAVLELLKPYMDMGRTEARHYYDIAENDMVAEFWDNYARELARAYKSELNVEGPNKLMKTNIYN